MRYVVALLVLLSFKALAVTLPDVVYYLAPETDNDPRQVYPLQLLQLALNKIDPWIQLKPSPFQMTQSRALTELMHDGVIDVVWSATSRAREQTWLPVRIPIYKGLLGYRVFLYQPESLDQAPAELSLAQLKQIPLIQGHDWPDIEILRANGFTTISTANYDATFRMLGQQRGRLYPRSVTEVWNEWQMYRHQGLAIEPKLMLHYTMPQYFFVSNNNPGLQHLIEKGLLAAIADGSFDELFNHYLREKIAPLRLEQRRIIELNNPIKPDILPDATSEFWYQITGQH